MDNQELIEKIFSPGSRVIVEYVDAQEAIVNCSTRVEDLEGLYLILRAPLVENIPIVFRESQELTLRRLVDQKKEIYLTNVFVIDIRQGKNPLLVCSKPQKIEKTSLRRFSRFGVDLPVKYTIGKTSGSGMLSDLSLNGCYALTDKDPQVNEGVVLNLSVSIPGEADIVVKGKVIRIDHLADSGKVGLAVDYHEISDAVKETIYNYIFQLQLTSDRFFGVKPDL